MLRRKSRRKGRNAKFAITPGGDKEEAGWTQPHPIQGDKEKETQRANQKGPAGPWRLAFSQPCR